MTRGFRFSAALELLLLALLVGICGCSSETDEQLLAKIDPGLRLGHFRGQNGAVGAVSTLLRRGHAKAKDPHVMACLITTGALLLNDNAQWTERSSARELYDLLKRYDDSIVVEGLVAKVLHDSPHRLHVLFLGVKLGIPRSQERLNKILDEHGDKPMAEDFLNSGSTELREGGRRWANGHGYSIATGMGSHRVSWGSF
jgi:hypothetical protein